MTVELVYTTRVTQRSTVVAGYIMRNGGHKLTINVYYELRRRSTFPSSP